MWYIAFSIFLGYFLFSKNTKERKKMFSKIIFSCLVLQLKNNKENQIWFNLCIDELK